MAASFDTSRAWQENDNPAKAIKRNDAIFSNCIYSDVIVIFIFLISLN